MAFHSLFAGRQVWIAETESDVVLGGMDLAIAETTGTTSVVMRFVLAKRHLGTAHWERLWSVDFVTRDEQVVSYESNSSGDCKAKLNAWTYVLPDRLIACDFALNWNDGEERTVAETCLLSSNDTWESPRVGLNDIEYQLFQTISIL